MNDSEARIQAAKRQGFFPLMILLERLLSNEEPVGGSSSPAEEAIRFRHDPELTFNTSDVSSVKLKTLPPDPGDFTAKSRQRYEITTTFLGLLGAVSPLPHYFSEEILQQDSTQQRDFLDIFHHRLISLFYRARLKFDYPDTYRSDNNDLWSRRLCSLVGFEPEERPSGSRLPPWRILRLSPFLAERHLTASALEVALEDGLDLAEGGVAIEQFVGTWVPVDLHQRTKLGRVNHALGRDLMLGSKIFDRTTKFNVVLGPIDRKGYERFYGGGEPVEIIHTTIATLVADPFEYDIVLWLEKNAASPLKLTHSGEFRLSRNAWLGGQPREERVRLAASRPAPAPSQAPTAPSDGSLF